VSSVVTRMLATAAAAAMAVTATAQTASYREVTATHLPPGLAGPCMDAAAADADGDGDLDLALAMEFQPNVLLLNDGSGAFADGSDRLPRTVHDSEDVAFADFDGDGDLDLAFVSEDDRTDELYLNDGAGRFTDASSRLSTHDVSNALAVLDLDADGAPDLLIGSVGTDRVLVNDGRGRFRDETAARWPQDGDSRTQDLELVDVDGDGDLDVAVGNEGQNQLYLNRDGRLVDVTESRLPQRADETREIRAADVDGDGDFDLLVANVRFLMSDAPQDYLLLNDGSGVFTSADRARFPEDARSNFTVQVVDLDRDGDPDVLAPSTVFARAASEFLVLFTDASGHAAVARAPDFDVRDTDGDGDLDVLVRDGDRSYVFENDGGRLLSAAGQGAWADTTVLEDVDIDDDGKPDAATSNIPLTEVSSRRSGGAAAQASEPAAQTQAAEAADAGGAEPAIQARAFEIQPVDVDRDGDVDVLVRRTWYMEASAGNYLALLNDGSGRFEAAAPGTVLPATADGNGFDIEVADFNGDGIADLFLCNRASIPEPSAAASSGGLQRLLFGEARD
jgi:hypothetical protein